MKIDNPILILGRNYGVDHYALIIGNKFLLRSYQLGNANHLAILKNIGETFGNKLIEKDNLLEVKVANGFKLNRDCMITPIEKVDAETAAHFENEIMKIISSRALEKGKLIIDARSVN